MQNNIQRFPEECRVSRFCEFITHATNPNAPEQIVFHRISGNALRVSPPTLAFIRAIQKNKSSSRSQLLRQLDRRSHSVLDLLFENGIIADAKADEFRKYWDFYPVSRGYASYRNKSGRRAFALETWDPARQKPTVVEFIPDAFELYFLELADGESTLREIAKGVAKHFRYTLKRTELLLQKAICEKISAPELQLLKFLPGKRSVDFSGHKAPQALRCPLFDFEHRPDTLRIKASSLQNGRTVNLKKFHQHDIRDAFQEFDEVETTVSHAFRFAHPALGGVSYGAAFFNEVQRRNWLGGGARILEVGGGTGVFAHEFQKQAHSKDPVLAKKISYSIADISPVLAESQRRQNTKYLRQMDFLDSSAERLRVPKASMDLILSNEVVADLRTVLLRKREILRARREKKPLSSTDPIALSHKFILEYGIPVDDAPEEFFFNLGTALFLQNIARVLKQGGHAILTEFGDIAAYPTATHHLNHDEYSIHWGQMAYLARRLGFKRVDLIDLPSFLPFNPHEEMLVGDMLEIRHVFQKLGKKPPPQAAYARADIQRMLQEIPEAELRGLEFLPLHFASAWGPSPWHFKALVLEK